MAGPLLLREPFTVFAIILYLALFFYIYAQLILVLVYGHKRWCYRTFLLYTCVLWAGLRVTLFSYYCHLEHKHVEETIPELSRHVGTAAYFMLFSFPLYLQFCVICLFVSYFSQIVRSSEDHYQPTRWRSLSYSTTAVVMCNIVVFVTNLVCAILIKQADYAISGANTDAYTDSMILMSSLPGIVTYVIYVRVLINGMMFIMMAVALAYLIMQVVKTTEVRLLLETEDMTQVGAQRVGIFIVTLYLLRTVANVLALIPWVKWVYDTDQVDLLSDSNYGYYSFIIVQILWEYLPTLASVVFFRVKKPVLSCYPPILEPLPGSGGTSDSEDSFSIGHAASHHILPYISFQPTSETWFRSGSENNLVESNNFFGPPIYMPPSPARRFLHRHMGYQPHIESH